MTNPHLQTEPRFIGAPLHDSRVVVVAVHGRGQTPDFMLEHVVARMHADDASWCLPAADASSWYPLGFLAELNNNQPRLDFALAALDEIAEHLLAQGVAAERIVWLGFSQGACVVSEWVARHPAQWAALVAFTGGYIGPPGVQRHIPAPVQGMPAYFGVGSHDDWVPVDRVVETASLYVEAGAQVTMEVFPGRPHEVCDQEIAAAQRILDRIGR